MRIAPAQKPSEDQAPSEDGFILIEVLVSALVLAIVAAAVLALLSATTHSAASERSRSQAVGLAQEDQARLRNMRITSLTGLSEERPPIKLDGTDYKVKSEGTFVNAGSNEVTCNGESSVSDYVRITSRVSSPAMASSVELRSIVSPSNGSLDQNHGTISLRVTTGKGRPVSGVALNGKGSVNFQGSTDETGCVNFADLPEGNYQVTVTGNGMINPKGESTTITEYSAPRASTRTYSLMYDVAGAVEPTFVYQDASSGKPVEGRVDSIEVFNVESGLGAATFGTPGGPRTATVTGSNLFPFKTTTNVYAGACETNNPSNPAARASVEVPPGGIAKPVITLPALYLNLTYGTTPISGARVTTIDSKCKVGPNAGKRVYTTDAGGHLATTSGLPDAGMPWGEYEVCASATVNGTARMVKEKTVAVNTLPGGTLNLNLQNGTTGSTCP